MLLAGTLKNGVLKFVIFTVNTYIHNSFGQPYYIICNIYIRDLMDTFSLSCVGQEDILLY